MAIFKKTEPQLPTPRVRERTTLPGRSAGADGAMSIIGAGMVVIGDIVTDGIVRVEGEVRGTIRAAKAVILGHGGRLDGDILTEEALIGGTVHGAIIARGRIELQSTSEVAGEIRARPQGVKLDEGARFAGQIRMLEEETAGVTPPEPAPEYSAPESSYFRSAVETETDESESEQLEMPRRAVGR